MKKKLSYEVLYNKYLDLKELADKQNVIRMEKRLKKLEKEKFEADLLIIELLKERGKKMELEEKISRTESIVDEIKDLRHENYDLRKQISENEDTAIKLLKENNELIELYRRTCNHLFSIGNDELARYFQAQINECPVFITQGSDKSDR